MEYTTEQCIADTKEHIYNVQKFIDIIIKELELRAERHDLSKLESPELETFVEYTPKLKNSTYDSEEYKDFLKGMSSALKHHYGNNRHHPEHFNNGVKEMNLVDLVEMFCDWYGATMRHENGDIRKSIEINKKRFELSDDLVSIFHNTVDLINKE